jgi:hypothetical protein
VALAGIFPMAREPGQEVVVLTREQLVELYRSHRDVGVLSVYVDGTDTDPANRRAWATRVRRGLEEQRARVASSEPEELAAFDAARRGITGELERFEAFMPARGWAGFATPEGLPYAEPVPVPMPDLVRWEHGPRVAPYVRALKQNRVVAVALADRRQARLFSYKNGDLIEQDTLRADLDFGDLSESGASNRGSGHTGSRGEPGTDAGHRLLDIAAAELQARAVTALERLARHDGHVVLGGTAEVVASLTRKLEPSGVWVVQRPELHLAMTLADVREAVEAGASELTCQMQEQLLHSIIELARSGGRGCLGLHETLKALDAGRVQALLLSRVFRERDPDMADRLVGAAFEQGAKVEELSGSGAELLQREGQGVAARLRYTYPV